MTDTGPNEDRLMSHSYDGIMEYDNPMPGWWVWMFTASIIFCVPYVMWYHLGAGPSIYEKLDAELAAYDEFLLDLYGELEPDEETILHYAGDEAAMKAMGGVFDGKCALCHNKDGGGGGNAGANLTDDSWIHVATITDIAEVLTNGRPVQGMPAWKDQLTETQIVLLSSYVAHLQKYPVPPPGGKEPQGERVEPWPIPVGTDADQENE